MAKKKPTGGRPKGARTKPRPQVDAQPSRCPKCGSTEREPYKGSPIERRISGVKDGVPYTHVLWRRTSCTQCGQHRTDIVRENRPEN